MLGARECACPRIWLFWYELALKMVMTATIVVIASVAVERSGPFIGALIAALPTAAGAAYIILAIEHPPAFIAASAIGSACRRTRPSRCSRSTYAVLAQRHGIVLSIAVATLVWLVAAAALRLVRLDAGDAHRAQCRRLRRHRSRSARAIAAGVPRSKHAAHALRHPAARRRPPPWSSRS